jgi:phage tail sheath protein FI
VAGNALEYSPTQSERDLLQGIDTSNRINPLVQFAEGITIWGNRTSQRSRSALESVNIRRMLLHAEKVCATAVRVLAFDPNDPVTWRQFTMLVNEQLNAIKAGRGIAQFKVICDATTNPAEQRQQKTMRGKMIIEPVEAAEIIMLDFALTATGANFSNI